MTNNLNLKRITIYTQYSLLYNTNDIIKAKILNSNLKSLNVIYNTYIKNTKIAPKDYFKALINGYLFKKAVYSEQTLILCSQIDKYMRSSFNNSIKSKKFQELIDNIDEYLLGSNSTDLCVKLRKVVQSKYVYIPKVSFIAQKRNLLTYTQNNIHELRELLQWITHIRYMNRNMRKNGAMNNIEYQGRTLNTMNLNNPYIALTTTQRLRHRQCGEYYSDGYYVDNLNNFYDIFLSQNNYARQIFKELGADPLEIKNLVLKSKIEALITQNSIDMYNIDYGYNQSDKYDAKNLYMQNALPSVISGEVKDEFKATMHQTIILYTKIHNFKALKNRLFNNAQITVHDEGFNPMRSTNKYYVIYTYKMTNDQLRTLPDLARRTLNKLDKILAPRTNDVLSEAHKCTYTFNYKDSEHKARKFNKFNKYLGIARLNYMHIFLPINGRTMIPNCWAHKSWWIDQKDAIRFKGGNIERNVDTTLLNPDAHKIFIMYDLYNALTMFYEGITKRRNLNDGLTYGTTDLFQITHCAELLKHISIDLVHTNDEAYLINYLSAIMKNQSTIMQERTLKALVHYKTYGYIPQSNLYIAHIFLAELKKYFTYIIYRRVDTDRTIKELIDYGLNIARKSQFPSYMLRMPYIVKKIKHVHAESIFDELLDPECTTVEVITKQRYTGINSYYLIKLIWEVLKRIEPDTYLIDIIFSTILRFLNVEKSCFND